MVADAPALLCTWAQLTEGPLGDLVRSYPSGQAQADLLAEATRLCEDIADRRLAPFTGLIETERSTGIDPDEYIDAGNVPLDLAGTLGRSYAYAMGTTSLVRHGWLQQWAPKYQDLWTYSLQSITIHRSYGGDQVVNLSTVRGPDADTGHLWYNIGTFLPIGSLVTYVYGGGYSTMPASLVRAGKWMAGSIAARELDPTGQQHGHDPHALLDWAHEALAEYGR
ncbi:hypothetical protein ABIA32_002695 [Streptacidiphilus sp. MAP12-20]|uniref:hypothetical protein n=1 Tax=Streptacidiphilus sp. MAP12-20 TaxID=3156299 RepID=UPI003519267E